MEIRLDGRVALITGGSMGLGRAMGEMFAESGAAVVLVDDECDGPRLAAQVDALLADPARLGALGRAARRLGRPHAAAVIAADVLALAGHAAGRAEPVLTRE